MGFFAKVLTLGMAGKDDLDPIDFACNIYQCSVGINFFCTRKQLKQDLEKAFGKNLEARIDNIDGIMKLHEYGASGISDIQSAMEHFEGHADRRLLKRTWKPFLQKESLDRILKLSEAKKIPSLFIYDVEKLGIFGDGIKEFVLFAYYEYLRRSGAKNKIKFFANSCSECKSKFTSIDHLNELGCDEDDIYTYLGTTGCCSRCGQFQGVTPENKYFSQALKIVRAFEETSKMHLLPRID